MKSNSKDKKTKNRYYINIHLKSETNYLVSKNIPT